MHHHAGGDGSQTTTCAGQLWVDGIVEQMGESIKAAAEAYYCDLNCFDPSWSPNDSGAMSADAMCGCTDEKQLTSETVLSSSGT